jgi:hypothetical protein
LLAARGGAPSTSLLSLDSIAIHIQFIHGSGGSNAPPGGGGESPSLVGSNSDSQGVPVSLSDEEAAGSLVWSDSITTGRFESRAIEPISLNLTPGVALTPASGSSATGTPLTIDVMGVTISADAGMQM